VTLDLMHLDGDIVLEGLEDRTFGGLQGPRSAIRLTNAEVRRLVRFALELWPDMLTIEARVLALAEKLWQEKVVPLLAPAPGRAVTAAELVALESAARCHCEIDSRHWVFAKGSSVVAVANGEVLISCHECKQVEVVAAGGEA